MRKLFLASVVVGIGLCWPSEASAQNTIECRVVTNNGIGSDSGPTTICNDTDQFFEQCPPDGDGFGINSCGQWIWLNLINGSHDDNYCPDGYYPDYVAAGGTPIKGSDGAWRLSFRCQPYEGGGGGDPLPTGELVGGAGGFSPMPSRPSAVRILWRGVKSLLRIQ